MTRRRPDASMRCRAVLLLALFGLGGCGSAEVLAKHRPAHPTNSQTVTFVAEGKGTVDKIELSYERYSLSGSSSSKVQTLVTPMTLVNTCDPAGNVSSLTCTHTMTSAFPASSLINFKAVAYDDEGTTSSETYSFAAGDYPWLDDPIPIRLKDATDTKKSYDIAMVRDADITETSFRDQLDEVINDLYFKYEAYRIWRGLYNFYYSPRQANYEATCNFTDPSNMSTLTAVADAVLILHSTQLQDCRSGKRISSEINYDKTLAHESGHVLFGLRDEYCCGSSYAAQACSPNLWSSEADCQAAAPGLSLAASDCIQLSDGTQTKPFWRIDPTGTNGCLMGPSQHNSGSNFGPACRDRISHRVAKCLGGDCFPSPDCP